MRNPFKIENQLLDAGQESQSRLLWQAELRYWPFLVLDWILRGDGIFIEGCTIRGFRFKPRHRAFFLYRFACAGVGADGIIIKNRLRSEEKPTKEDK